MMMALLLLVTGINAQKIDQRLTRRLVEYDPEDITLLTSDDTGTSHGSHTSATAGGSETGNGMQGVAPEVDLVLCGLGPYLSTSNINDAFQHIFDYAASVNKPVVISCSLGTGIGLHDGSDGTAQLIAELTENGNKPGRAVLVSSGNSASNWQSIVRTLDNTTDTEFIPSHNPVQAGYGKIDAVAGLKKILNTTAIDAIEVGGHREATPATMYSIDAPVYNMMGQRIDKNTRGLVVYKGRKYVNQ